MSEIEGWTEANLQKLIDDGVQESLTLDYKASAALVRTDRAKSEISKDVSAFANSAGGRIVYGIREEQHLPIEIDDGVDPAQVDREWLESVIDSTINPRIKGLRIKAIPIGNGRFAYVVEIPSTASGGPHQANDQRYYKRTNFKSEPMFDYEVRDVLRRAEKPELYIITSWSDVRQQDDGKLSATMRVQIGNRASEPALYAAATVLIEKGVNPQVKDPLEYRREDVEIELPSGRMSFCRFQKLFLVPNHMPIYQEVNWNVMQATVTFVRREQVVCLFSTNCPGHSSLEAIRFNAFNMQIVEEKLETQRIGQGFSFVIP